jgi:hypothetical protein
MNPERLQARPTGPTVGLPIIPSPGQTLVGSKNRCTCRGKRVDIDGRTRREESGDRRQRGDTVNDIAPSRTRSPPGADPLLCRMSEPKDAESNIEHGGCGGERITCPSVAAFRANFQTTWLTAARTIERTSGVTPSASSVSMIDASVSRWRSEAPAHDLVHRLFCALSASYVILASLIEGCSRAD